MILLLAGVYSFAYLRAESYAADLAANYADMLMFNPENANVIISYEMLSDEYRSVISSEEYENADQPQERLDLYSNPIFRNNPDICVADAFQSTTAYKRTPDGYFLVGEQWYYIHHEIDLKPDFITLEPKIVRWYIKIIESDEPEPHSPLYHSKKEN